MSHIEQMSALKLEKMTRSFVLAFTTLKIMTRMMTKMMMAMTMMIVIVMIIALAPTVGPDIDLVNLNLNLYYYQILYTFIFSLPSNMV